MTSEKSQIKFAKSERTGELIGFVSRDSKTRQLKGVWENYALGKQICILSENLKGTIEPNVLYSVELKPMHKAKGYVVGRHTRTVSCDSRDHNRSQNVV